MLYTKFKENLIKGSAIDLINDTIKVALVTQAYVPNKLTDEFFSLVSSHEVVDINYPVGGVALANKSISIDELGIITFDADDVSWAISSQIVAAAAIIYKDTGNAATSPLIAVKEFIQLRNVIKQSFTIEWGANGIFRLR